MRKNSIYKMMTVMTLIATASSTAFAIPAKPGLLRLANSNGDSISVYLKGDERGHYYTTSDGYMLLRDDNDDFHYAVAEGKNLKSSTMLAADPKKRSVDADALLASFSKEAPFTLLKSRQAGSPIKRGYNRVAPDHEQCTFPGIGSPKICVILVEFSNNSFTVPNTYETFTNMFNQEGFSQYSATGSVLDFYRASSNGKFQPQVDIYGPVKLSKTISYYGSNDSYGNDKYPEQMVIDACTALDDTVDFSQYDTDNDGKIDNVYVFYAGYGEADGGAKSTIWPHSWDVASGAGTYKYFDGKLLDHYACSNELYYSSKQLAGIGLFCHEFGHVLGIPDLYDVDYSGAFTPDDYSLMDSGSYNNNMHTPPTHTGYERYALNWVDPIELSDPATISMQSIDKAFDDVYLIKTPSTNEYYILENRQKTAWDAYIPGHGMMIWHINYNASIWNNNAVNTTVGKQYVDIVEADNILSDATRSGDTFPGTSNVTSFTDDTTPSMKTWSGTKLESPITEIAESDGVITFKFKGGADIFDEVVAKEATDVTPGGFTGHWNKVDGATAYLISVYTVADNAAGQAADNLTYVDGYYRKNVGDVDSFAVTGLTPNTTYGYYIQATNGSSVSSKSNEITVTTLPPTLEYKSVNALPATDVTSNSFTANWEALEEADAYKVTLYDMQLGNYSHDLADFAGGTVPTGWSSYGTSSETANSDYAVELPSRLLRTSSAYIITSAYTDEIRSFSFWYRSSVDNDLNALVVQGKVNGEWADLATIQAPTNAVGGATFSLETIPANCTQFMIKFSRNSGYVAIDNIDVAYGGELTLTPIEGNVDIEVGNVTAYGFNGLEAERRYGYSVKGYNSEMTSLPSNVISVVTGASSGIEAIAGNNAEATIASVNGHLIVNASSAATVAIYDIAGRKVAGKAINAGKWVSQKLSSGIYVVSVNGTNTKVVVE